MESIRLFLGDWADAATALGFVLLLISTFLAIRNHFAKQATRAELAEMRAQKSQAERRVKNLLDGREEVNPVAFLEKLDDFSEEAQTEQADELAGAYLNNQKGALAAACMRLARAAMFRFAKDGELALDETHRLATLGAMCAPEDTGLSALIDEIAAIRRGDTEAERAAFDIDPDANYETLRRIGAEFRKKGHYRAALRVFEIARTRALTETGRTTRTFKAATTDLGHAFHALGDLKRAEQLLKQSIEIGKLTIGEKDPNFAVNLINLAAIYRDMGEFDKSEPLYKRAMEIDRATIGETDPAYAICLNNLASLYHSMGRFDEAEPLFEQALKIGRSTVGEEHRDYARWLNNFALLSRDMGRLEEAEPLFLQVIEIDKATLDAAHPDHATHLNNLAGLYHDMGRLDEAEPLAAQAVEIFTGTLPAGHRNLVAAQDRLAAIRAARDGGG